MQKKRRRKRKSIITVYIARAAVAIVLLIMLILMFCGCLYIRDWFRKDDADKNEPKVEADGDVDSIKKEDTSSEDEPELPQYPGVSIVVDPGHGGNDGGTSSTDGTVIEKEINLSIASEVQALLKKHGVEVTMTRDYDVYMSLDERVVAANQTNADFFVSLHCNYYEGDASIDGLEAFYCSNAAGSQKFAESIADAAKQIDEIAVRGATQNNYYVTKHTSMDAVLIEMGFLSNPTECEKLTSSDYQKVLAQAIVDGILQVFDEQNSADGNSVNTENKESSR
ncbi:MAG: N-acetylmuramoyl-L-alanine amidase [Tyzzerella sp.]|nr:N-acetylmuramoyl-L-alanine amidase [Tyzzerella sp.]